MRGQQKLIQKPMYRNKHSLKYITMGPILSDNDLKKIYKLSNKNTYKKTYKKKKT